MKYRLIALLCVLIGVAAATLPAMAADNPVPQPPSPISATARPTLPVTPHKPTWHAPKLQVITSQHNDRSPALKSVRAKPDGTKRETHRPALSAGNANGATGTNGTASTASATDPVVQPAGSPASFQVSASFEGIGKGIPNYQVGYAPSDANGAAGPNDYVQVVNTSIAVFDKQGNVLMGPTLIQALWTGFGGLCEQQSDGDPIVLYDQFADRWVVEQMEFRGADGVTVPFENCLAVSTSGDPTGTYYRYAFPRSTMPDYTKLGIWPDAYYLTDNDFDGGSSFSGPSVAAFDRNALLAGQPATVLAYKLSSGFSSLLPASVDGPAPPPVGAPNYLMSLGPDGRSLYEWMFHADFANPQQSSLSAPVQIPVAPFTNLCTRNQPCVGQPEVPRVYYLDSLGDRLMYRLAYRNFGDHESLVVSHSVDPGGGGALTGGVRWYEIRNPGPSPVVYQQGTYAQDNTFRWMGSAAMDGRGDIAVGFSLSSLTQAPSIAVAARVAGDPLGTLGQGERLVTLGGGVQQTLYRWGDYSSMSVDPADDCTFWYTQQYLAEDGDFNWHTRIASFKLPTCLFTMPTVSVTAAPNPASTNPIAVTARVSGAGSVPTGSITFMDGQTAAGTAPIVNGQASMNVKLFAGSRQVVALYSGDAMYSSGNSNAYVETVNLPPAGLWANPTPHDSYAGRPVRMDVDAHGGTGTMSVEIVGSWMTTLLGTIPLDSTGKGSGMIANLPVGDDLVTFSFPGDYNYGPSTLSIPVIVNGPSLATLYTFTGGAANGAPQVAPVMGSDGNLYGTTSLEDPSNSNFGTIYRLTPAGQFTVLHTFTNTNDPWSTTGRLMAAADGSLYGALEGGGYGAIYRITPAGTFNIVHTFNGLDGADAEGPLAQGPDGTLYGATLNGGTYARGNVFSMTPDGVVTSLYSFTGGLDGWGPRGGITRAPDGTLFGVTNFGGTMNAGTIYKIGPDGTFTRLYSFQNGADGAFPYARPALGADGSLYGTASSGPDGQGVVYRLTTSGSFSAIHLLAGGDGAAPLSDLTAGPDGNLYGTAVYGGDTYSFGVGTIFTVTTAGGFSVLRTAQADSNGFYPFGGLSLGADGRLYGTTELAAYPTWGTVYSITVPPAMNLVPTPVSNAVENQLLTMNLATFTGGVGPFTVDVDFGDGTSSYGVAQQQGSSWTIVANHTYTDESPRGTPYQAVVTVHDSRGDTKVTTPVVVNDGALSAGASTKPIHRNEGDAFSGPIGIFTDANPAAGPADYTASIDWGDGTKSVGSIALATTGWVVSGSHKWIRPGTFNVVATVTDDGGSSLVITQTAQIADYPITLTASSVPSSTRAFSGVLAKLSDPDPNAAVGLYTVSISWGDGSTSAGTVSGSNPFAVAGKHTYAAKGKYQVTVKVTDVGGASASAQTTITVKS